MTKLEQKKQRIREYAKAFIAGNQTDEEYAKDLRDEAIEFAFHMEKKMEKKLAELDDELDNLFYEDKKETIQSVAELAQKLGLAVKVNKGVKPDEALLVQDQKVVARVTDLSVGKGPGE